MTEKTQVNIRVNNGRKERWDDTVEDSATYDSITHLITLAVQKELQGKEQETTSRTDGEAVQKIRDDVVPELTKIERGIGALDQKLERVREDTEQEVGHNLQKAVIDVLPEYREEPQNNSKTSPKQIHEKLETRGFDVDPEIVEKEIANAADTLAFVRESEHEMLHGKDKLYYKRV